MKNTDFNIANTPVDQEVKDFDTESNAVIEVAKRKSSNGHGDGYRIWRCYGVPVGIHIHNKPT